jgi:hypothetical protein
MSRRWQAARMAAAVDIDIVGYLMELAARTGYVGEYQTRRRLRWYSSCIYNPGAS